MQVNGGLSGAAARTGDLMIKVDKIKCNKIESRWRLVNTKKIKE